MKLITVASYADVLEAQVARNYLEDAGIRAVLADENLVTVVLPYQIAVGGVKIQVKEEDAEAALRLLAEYRGDGVNAEDLERQAVAAQAEEVEPQPAGEAPPEDILSEGELLAHRALWGAVLGMLFLPFQFVVLWMVYRALVSEAPLRPRYFRRAWCAFFIAAGSLILIWLSFMGLLWY